MTYFYDVDELPEVIRDADGTYLIDGRRFCASTPNPANGDSAPNTEENIQYEIDLRLALLHFVQAENDRAVAEQEAEDRLVDFVKAGIEFIASLDEL